MPASIDWEALWAEFEVAIRSLSPAHVLQVASGGRIADAIAPVIAAPTADDLAWIISALQDPQRRWFVVGGVDLATSIHRDLFTPLMRAAVDTRPGLCKSFVRPCVRAFGIRAVYEFLFGILEQGTNAEKECAGDALYEAYGEAVTLGGGLLPYDLVSRRRTLVLHNLVETNSLLVQRSVVRWVELDEELYESDMRPLVRRAIDMAGTHPDEFVRRVLTRELLRVGTEERNPTRSDRQAR